MWTACVCVEGRDWDFSARHWCSNEASENVLKYIKRRWGVILSRNSSVVSGIPICYMHLFLQCWESGSVPCVCWASTLPLAKPSAPNIRVLVDLLYVPRIRWLTSGSKKRLGEGGLQAEYNRERLKEMKDRPLVQAMWFTGRLIWRRKNSNWYLYAETSLFLF